ncbi:MAG: hypothetical protein K2X48_08520 [Chitinophagaceae bacterium]|nr:hypothetical protein [Chitinophagaceae bacterium]
MPAEIKTETPKPEATFAAASAEKKKLRKKVNMKMFSRAPLREEVVAPDSTLRTNN